MKSPHRIRPALLYGAAGLIALVWAVLYLPNLRTSPGWYGDETLIHHTSRNLVSGIPSNMALWATFWHPHYPYQPLYSYINGLFAQMAGGDLQGSRFFNTLLALACAQCLYFLGRKSFGIWPALFAATLFLCYEQAIIHFRMSYAHNAVGLGLLVMTLSLLRPARARNDWVAGGGLLLAAGSHPLFIHGALAAFLCRIRHPRSWIRLFLPAGIYVLVSLGILYAIYRGWLIEDLIHLKNSFLGRGESDGGGLKGLQNFALFARQDWFHVLTLAGLALCIPLRKYAAPIVGFLILFLLVRNRQNLIPFYYHAIVIFPVLCIGWAGLMRYVMTRARRFRLPRKGLCAALFLLPCALFVQALPHSLKGDFHPRNHHWVTQSTKEVEDAAQWLNARTAPGDVVAGNPNIAWLLKAETVPYLQLITWYGLPTQGYENGNSRERFRFPAGLENCKYAVAGDIDRRWAFFEPNVGEVVKRFESERWPVVWQGPNYLILENPNYVPSKDRP
jgi:hypothetical protein